MAQKWTRTSLCAAITLSVMVLWPAMPDAQTYRQRDGDRAERGRPDVGDRYFHDERRGQGVWQTFGVVKAAPRLEREVVQPKAGNVAFGRVGLKVFDADIEVVEIQVRYGNNELQRFPINKIIKAGTNLPPVEVRGERRGIQQIEVIYRPYGPARVAVMGEVWRPNRPGARWEDLGCQRVGLIDDKDVIRVGLDEGRFRAIKLTAEGNKVRLVRVRIVYGNGQADDFSVRAVIPEGSETQPIDLRGNRRGIDRIELNYLPAFNLGSRATVCAYGIQ